MCASRLFVCLFPPRRWLADTWLSRARRLAQLLKYTRACHSEFTKFVIIAKKFAIRDETCVVVFSFFFCVNNSMVVMMMVSGLLDRFCLVCVCAVHESS